MTIIELPIRNIGTVIMNSKFVVALVSLFFANAVNAYVVDTGGVDFGNSSWDSPNENVAQVLDRLEDEVGVGLRLTLVDQESWVGLGSRNVILEELAGYRNRTTFGWYDASDSSNAQQVFSGSDNKASPAQVADFGGLMNVGFYIDPNGNSGNRMYTEHLLNSHDDIQVAIFKVENLENTFILGWEDLDLNGGNGGDRDYQDMIVRVQFATVAEPGTIALLGLGMLGLVANRRLLSKS